VTAAPLVAFVAFWLIGWAWGAYRRRPLPAVPPAPRPMPREPALDFEIVKLGPAHSTIRWRGGREEVVTPSRLSTLKKTFLWGVDIPV